MRHSTTLILAAVVLVAAVLVWVYREELTGELKPPERPADTRDLLEGLALDDLQSARLEQAGPEGQMTLKAAFAKQDDKWRLAEPVAAAADDYEVRRLLRAAAEAKYRQTIDPAAAGQPALKDLGLEPPAFRLTLVGKAKADAEPRTVVVDVGRKAAVGEGLYVRLGQDAKAIVLASDDLLERARERLQKYRNRNLLDLERDQVVRVDLEGPKGRLRLDRAEQDADRWVIAEPMAARADPDAAAGILRTALGAMVADFVDDRPQDLGRYGLAEPRLSVTLYKAGPPPEPPKEPAEPKSDEKKEEKKPEPVKAAVLKFGAWADLKKESVYLALEDAAFVVSVEDDTFKGLDKGLADLRDKHVLALDPGRVSSAAVRVPTGLAAGGKDVAYDLAKVDGQWMVKVEGRADAKADPTAVDDLLKELKDLKVLYFAEGEHADVAKAFKPAGSVRVQVEKEAAAGGFEIGGPAKDAPALVKNLREDWVGRINEKDLAHLGKDWLALLDRQVLALDPKKATRLAIRAPDRTVVFEKKDEKWALLEPVKEDARAAFADDRLADLKDLRCTAYLAATKDFGPWNLKDAELTVTVTLAPEKEGEKPVEKTLLLSHHERAKVVGRVPDGDLVFELPMTLFKDLVGEPLPAELVDLFSSDITHLEVEAGATKVGLRKVDGKWFRLDAAGRPGEEVDTTKVDDVVRAAADLDAVRWAACDAKEPARFGLDKPALRITIAGEAEKARATLLIADKPVDAKVAALFDEEPLRYAMAEGGKRIAILAGKKLETLLGAPKALSPQKEETRAPASDKAKAEPAADKKTPHQKPD